MGETHLISSQRIPCRAGQITDCRGEIGAPFKAYDTLAVLLRRGSITVAEHDAGREFEETFRTARLDPLRAADLGRVPGGSGAVPGEAALAARRRVGRKLKAMGGPMSPGGAVLWAVLGEGVTLKAFAAETRLAGGRALDERAAKGMLVAALGVLAGG